MKSVRPYPIAVLGAVLTAAVAAPQAGAAVIGLETFSYANGAIANQTGGTGWANERTDEPGAPAVTASDWDNVGGTPTVVSGVLVTNGTSAKREFAGATEGSASPSNEREGAFRGSGIVYFSMTYSVDTLFASGTNQWGGFSSYDFGTERIFFGMPGQTTATRYFGIDESGIGTTLSTIPVNASQNYLLVGAVDFDNDRLKLWVNPDGSDFDSGVTSSADVVRTYTGTNWSSAVRLGSAAGANVSWDNLRVTTTFAEAVPEPSGAFLAAAGLVSMARRRRRVS